MTLFSNHPESSSFPSLIADIQRMYTTTLYRQLRLDGIELTSAQWRVIVHLNHLGGPTQSELADSLLIEKAPLGSLLDKMEACGLVERRPDPQDRRAKRVHLMPKALPLISPMEKKAMALREQTAEGLSNEEQQQLTQLLTRLHQNLQNIRNSG